MCETPASCLREMRDGHGQIGNGKIDATSQTATIPTEAGEGGLVPGGVNFIGSFQLPRPHKSVNFQVNSS